MPPQSLMLWFSPQISYPIYSSDDYINDFVYKPREIRMTEREFVEKLKRELCYNWFEESGDISKKIILSFLSLRESHYDEVIFYSIKLSCLFSSNTIKFCESICEKLMESIDKTISAENDIQYKKIMR